MDAIEQTALMCAAARATETDRPDRLFQDPLAGVLAGPRDAAPEGGDITFVAIRTRFFDEWLERVTGRERVRQVVLLAAGMDSRAFRLSWPDGVTVWELDRPAVVAEKERLLARVEPRATCVRRCLPVDLLADDWSAMLRATGFQAAAPSAWLVEAFLSYLDEASAERLLASITALAAPGSRLAADFPSADYLESPLVAAAVQRLEREGTPFRFGTNDPEALLERHGWRPEVVAEPGQEGVGEGRWPWPVAPREVAGVPRAFFVAATRGR